MKAYHVRDLGDQRIELIEEDVPVRDVALRVGDVSHVKHQVNVLFQVDVLGGAQRGLVAVRIVEVVDVVLSHVRQTDDLDGSLRTDRWRCSEVVLLAEASDLHIPRS